MPNMNAADLILNLDLPKTLKPSFEDSQNQTLLLKIWHTPQDYVLSYEAMKAFTAARVANVSERANIADELWLLTHPDVYTLGQAALASHLLKDEGVPLVRVDRGGQITYHGAGQVVIYCLIDLKRLGIYVRELVQRIESAIIACLADYDLVSQRHEGAPGIYISTDISKISKISKNKLSETTDAVKMPQSTNPFTNLAKVAALGLKVSQGCTYHGLALNVAVNLNRFSNINPCGYIGLETIDMKTAQQDFLPSDDLNQTVYQTDQIHKVADTLVVGQHLAKHLAHAIYG
jgi:lipoyl(octanoyl) transferase